MTKEKGRKSFDGSPVGYKKPPVDHQFRKGGKKPEGSGRKKGSKNSRTLIEEILSEEVTVKIGQKQMTISKLELLIRLGFEKAIKANSVREHEALVKLFERLAPQSIDPVPAVKFETIPGDGLL